jgi:hypothetical protein
VPTLSNFILGEDLIGAGGGRRITLRAGEALGVTLRVDGFAVFVRGKIGNQVDWLAAKFAGYLWRWVALHKRLLYIGPPRA